MMNKQTQTFNFYCFYFSYYIILCFLEIFKELGVVFFCGILGFGPPPPSPDTTSFKFEQFPPKYFCTIFTYII